MSPTRYWFFTARVTGALTVACCVAATGLLAANRANPPASGTRAVAATTNAQGRGEALIAAADRGDVAQITALLSSAVPVDSTWGPRRITPLIAAAQKGRVEAVRGAVDSRPDPKPISVQR